MIGNHLEPFKFWCQKVLPNVYDDSLSYYEYLCKLNEYLNEVIGQINTLTDNMEDYEADLTATWLETKEYIDNYFNNLDVQQEINNKLDQMAESGTLSTLLAPIVGTQIGGVVADQIDATVASQIGGTVASQIDASVGRQIAEPTATATASWLSEHVTPVGSAVVVDDTLTITGAAADAKATGDAINDLRYDLSPTAYNLYTRMTPGSNNIYKYKIESGKTYRFELLGASGTTSVIASTDGVTQSLIIIDNGNVGSVVYYTATGNYDYLMFYRSTTDTSHQCIVSSGEIVDSLKQASYIGNSTYDNLRDAITEQINYLGNEIDNSRKMLLNKDILTGEPMYKSGTDITIGDITNFGLLSSARITGETTQQSGTPTPSDRKLISCAVQPDASGKYNYVFTLYLKNGTTISKTIALTEGLYEDDYIDIFEGKLYKYDYEKKLDGTVLYNRQVYGDKARYLISGAIANESATGYCDGFVVNGTPLSSMTIDNSICCYSGGQSIFFVFNTYTSADDVKEYFRLNPMKYIYKMKTPVVTDLPDLKGLINSLDDVTRIICSTGVTLAYTQTNKNTNLVYVGRRVGYTGINGDYSSILRALKETSNNTTVIVGRGTYNIVDEYTDYYGNDFWTNYSGYGDGTDKFLRGLWIAFGRKIIFDPMANVVFNYTGNNTNVRTYFSPFATGGDGTIIGLHLTFNSGCRYAVHDDFAESDGIFTYKDCVFNGQAQSDTIGAGCGQSNQYIIENCVFLGSTSLDHDDISYHNSGFSSGKCTIVVKDCYCENGIHFKWYGTSTDITECIVTNCKARRVICTAHTATPHDVQNMVMYSWNNITTE